MSKVVLLKCDSYDYELVKEALSKGFELLGGVGRFAKKDERILLKPNLLSADPPEKCVTTHHIVFKAVGELLKKTEAKLSYGDSPGYHSTEAAAQKSGIAGAASELQIPLADFKNGTEVVFNEGRQNKKFVIAKGVLDSDGLISLPKLKTHAFARVTGSVKNQFGCIPGFLKGEYHVKLPDANDFCRMLVDLNMLLKPRLYIMDGIMAMEGNGPRGGTPKKMGLLLMSEDPIALDATVCRIIDMNPDFVPTLKLGYEAGLGTYHEKEIEILGDKIEDFVDKSFNVIREPVKTFKFNNAMKFMKNSLLPKPIINQQKCVKCGVCVNVCPVRPKALEFIDGNKKIPPVYNYNRCIRCFCCQELCPESIINVRYPLIRRIFDKSARKKGH